MQSIGATNRTSTTGQSLAQPPGAAVAAAMREVLIGALAGFGTPEQQAKGKERTDAAYAAALMKIPDGRAKQDGIGVGQAAAIARARAWTRRNADGASRTPAAT